MLDTAIAQLLEEDRRYPLEAYVFVFEALHYAQNVLEMGAESRQRAALGHAEDEDDDEAPQRHVTGQELCEAIRQLRPGAVRLHGQDGVEPLGHLHARATSARSCST